ncbi:hypothetical protein [Deinococcus sp.]|uniref:hypothetical protein n=1 Tax=Deinococcus sp. TaxID=47478 RepID=UPI003C7AB21C
MNDENTLSADLQGRFGAEGLAHRADLEALRPLLVRAILFLANRAAELPDLIALAHADPAGLLNAATVKEERG